MRFVAWAGADADGLARLRVFRVADGGTPVHDPVVDRPLDAHEEADAVLAACGWTRCGSWWRVPTGARATVTPRDSVAMQPVQL